MRRKTSCFIALILIFNILSVFMQLPVMAEGNDYKFNPIADTYSQLGGGLNNNYGDEASMTVRGPDYRSAYLKFDLSTVEGIATSAKLTVYTTSNVTGATMRLEAAQSNDWAEDTLKGNNRPTYGYSATNAGLSAVDMPGVKNAAMVFDVPVSVIEAALSTNEKYITLVLYNNENEVNMKIHSREASNSAYHPALEIVTTDTVTDEVCVSKDYSDLTFSVDYPLTKESFALPQTGSNGSSISWSSDSPYIKVENGVARVIGRPARNQSNATVTLTALISKGTAYKEKAFEVVVLNNSHPIEDAYTRGYTPQNHNFGRSTVLTSRSNSSNVSYMRSHLKFDILDMGLESNRYITSAKLKLTSDRTDAAYNPQMQYVALALTDDWSAGEFDNVDITQDGIDADKKGITHNTRPGIDETSEVFATCETTGTQKGDIYEFDVRALVNDRINSGKDVVSFVLYSKDFTDKHYEFYSNEASDGRPVLEIEWEVADGVAPNEISGVRCLMRDNGMRVIWDDPTDADYAKTLIYSGEELLAEVIPGEQSYVIEGIKEGEEYSLKICTEDKFSNKSDGITVQGVCPVAVSDTTAPAQVSNVKTESGDKQIRLAWTAPDDEDYKKTVIRYAVDGESKEKSIMRGINSCVIESLPNKVNFDFEIYTVDYDGNESEPVCISEKTTEAFRMTLDTFDSSTTFKNGVEVIKDETAPDESAGYGRMTFVTNNTYKYASIDGAALAEFGATGIRFFAKSNYTLKDRMLFFVELRETEDGAVTKTYQAHLGLMFNGTEWTQIYAPFDMFERVGGTAVVDFKPMDLSKVTQIRLISTNLDSAKIQELEICMDDFGAYVELDEPNDIRVTEADKRLSLSWKCDNAVNIYKDGTLIDTVSTGNYIYDGLENNTEYTLELSAVDKNERETQKVHLSGTPSENDAKIEYSRFMDGWDDEIEYFKNGQKIYTKTKIVADTNEKLSLVYEFYDIDNQVIYSETVEDISLVNGECFVEKDFVTPENAQICLVHLQNVLYDEPYVIPEKEENEFAVSSYFADHMVIQRDNPVIVWGKAPVGETVTVSINGTTKTAVAKNGTWKVKMPAMEYSTSPIEMSVACNGEEVKYTDILVGDVYIGSGQSNMAFKAVNSIGGTDMLNNSPDDGIRIYSPTITSSNNPKENPENVKWFAAEGTSPYVREIFATPYFFAMEMRKVYPDIPIGIVQAGFNGSFMEAWVDRDGIKTLVENGVKMTANQAYVKSEWSGLYNGNIYPIRDVYAKAVLWYQGEANGSDGYMDKLKMMISNWRNTTQNKKLPFIIVNLPIFETSGDWPLRREIQYEATQQIPDVGMATLYELGNRFDIHPNNKQPVGHRWSLVARHMLFGENIEYSGPVYDSCEVVGNDMYLTFTHADGLNNGGGNDPINGFEICGVDGNYVAANAEITEDGRVRLYAEGITPYAARYAWADALPTEGYVSSEIVGSSFVLTYRDISSRYNVGDEISGFYITDGSAYTKANAVISGENQVTVTKQNNASINSGETAAYAFLEFPFRNANLYNSQQLPAVPFRTIKDMLTESDINLELDINEYVTGKINLPSTDADGEYTVTWSTASDNVVINGNVAEVIRPSVGEADATGKLVAQIKKGEAIAHKTFEFKIPSLSYPEASAYCQSGSSVTFNFGASPELRVRTETNNALYMVSYMKFDISYLKKDIDNAVLKLTLMKANESNKPEDLRVAFCENDDWFTGTDNGVAPENGGVTWKTSPYFERTSQIIPTSTNNGTAAGDVYEFDVTELVQREFLNGDGYITFAVYADTPLKNLYQFNNISAQNGRPELCVTETDDKLYISNNGKKLDGKYSAGSLNISADTTSADSMLIAAFYENDVLVKSAVDYSANIYKSVELNIDKLKNTKVKIFNFNKNTLSPYGAATVLYPTEAFEVVTKYPNWTQKAVTFSFDDGRIEDIPLIEAFNAYGIKGTFNLNSNKHTDPSAVTNAQWVVDTYKGHEVASHVKNHPSIANYTPQEYIQLIKEGKDELSEIVGYEVTGMAYPLDDPGVEEITQYVCSEESGIEYARPSSPMRRDFELPSDFYNWRPSIKFTEMDYYGKAFLDIRNDNKMRLFYAWGHSYELNDDNYYLIHDFGKAVKDREDLYLATNIDICLYLKALNKLEITQTYVKNNSDIPLYISINNINHLIEPGMTISAD